ncbi:twin-arginine translocation signal domain-containing protein (plasmid) [Rhizobium sp. CCGE531]|nr:twin-arginine translocation signal domain-containing protein [Rhizobium sp. CCGE531]AYG75670.1 twin-arginine translocation signal domain-containing protein [Rhizobium sp. CCGE532]
MHNFSLTSRDISRRGLLKAGAAGAAFAAWVLMNSKEEMPDEL